MFDYLYEWMQNIAFYLILMTAAIQVIPDNSYKKYIRFFTGLILMVLLISPVLKLFQVEQAFNDIYDRAAYKQELQEIEKATEYLQEMEEYSEQQN